MAKKERRNRVEIKKLVDEINDLRTKGMSRDAACEKVGLSGSTYDRHAKGLLKRIGGAVKASDFPPRPDKVGRRSPRPINLNDVGALAHRISVLDRKIQAADFLTRERKRLAERLMELLKGPLT